ncbi:hypothetical protein ACXIUT_06925 [Achromobacter denitrificans]
MVSQVAGTYSSPMPGLYLSVQDGPIQIRPSTTWMDTLNVSIPSLRSTPGDARFSGLPAPDATAAPGDPAPAAFQKNFSFGFTPDPTYWVTFGSAGKPPVQDMPAANPALQMAPQLKA